MSWPVLRPLSGSDCTVVPESTSPTVVVSVCRIGDDAGDLHASPATLPDRHLQVEARDLLGFERERHWSSTVRKPCSSALTT